MVVSGDGGPLVPDLDEGSVDPCEAEMKEIRCSLWLSALGMSDASF